MTFITGSAKRMAWSVLVVLLISGCGKAGPNSTGGPEAGLTTRGDGLKLVLTGSSTVAPLAQEIAQRFEAENPGSQVDVQTGGSSRGIADARAGLANIGMASRALKPEEGDLTAHTIALDGICVIVHADNPVESLSEDEVRAVYLGQETRWEALGGADLPITVVNKAEGRATLELFLAYYGLKSTDIRASVVIGDNEQGIKTVSTNPGAIGYVSIGAAEFAVEDGVPIKLLPMSGIAPTTGNVKNGTYPLTRPLNLVTPGAPSGFARTFINFAQSEKVNDLITGLSYVPLR